MPNGVKNSIDTIDGKKIHVQRVEKIIVTKQKDATKFGTISNTYGHKLYYINSNIYGEKGKCDNAEIGVISNKFIGIADDEWRSSEKVNCCFMNINGVVHFLVDKTEFPSQETFNDWLEKNEITVYYPLAEPIYTYLESGLYDEITIPTSNIKNEIYLENGKWYHKRNIGKVIFDGSSDEKWNYYNKDSLQRFDIKMPNEAKMYNVRTPVYTEGYQFEASKNEDKIIFISGVEGFNKLYIYNYAYTSVEDFRVYLTKNPLEVYYELAEPVVSELPFSDITYKLNEPLRSLPNIYDTIENNQLIQRVGKVVLDGSDDEYWVNGYGSGDGKNNRFEVGFNYAMGVTTNRTIYGLSDKFRYFNTSGIPPSGCFRMVLNTANRLFILFNPSTDLVPLEDLSAWKAWLSENPVTVYYELATPIETEITPDMILINEEPITDIVGIELPDGTCDSIENGCYVKRVGKVIFDGSDDEEWTIERTANNLMNAGILIESAWNKPRDDIASGKIDYYFFSDKLPNQCTTIALTTTEGIMLHMRYAYVRILLSKLLSQNINGLRNYLSENPITVWYKLATPVKIPLFLIKEGLTTLKSTNNITPQIELDCLVRDGFQNICDNKWERGDINITAGVNDTNSGRIRLINYIKVKPNTSYKIDITNLVLGKNIGLRCYDISKTYISGGLIGDIKSSTYTFTTPENCYYIRFIVETTDVNFKIYLKEVF